MIAVEPGLGWSPLTPALPQLWYRVRALEGRLHSVPLERAEGGPESASQVAQAGHHRSRQHPASGAGVRRIASACRNHRSGIFPRQGRQRGKQGMGGRVDGALVSRTPVVVSKSSRQCYPSRSEGPGQDVHVGVDRSINNCRDILSAVPAQDGHVTRPPSRGVTAQECRG